MRDGDAERRILRRHLRQRRAQIRPVLKIGQKATPLE